MAEQHDVEQRDPLTVFRLLLEGISSGRWHDLADLYAEDCVVQIPLALPEPVHLVGRDSVRARFVAAAAAPFTFQVTDPRLHRTSDPEVVIGEFGYAVVLSTTGHTFSVANIQVIRVHDGLISESRDYHDHARLAQIARTIG
jgi:uncharacterized protein